MNRKIICLIMLGIMIISVQPILSAMELQKSAEPTNADSINAEIVTVTIHAFKDENKNGVQDLGEGDAANFIVKSSTKSPWFPEVTYKGRTDYTGKLSFETEKDNPLFAVWVQQYSDSDRSQYKSDGAIGGFLDPIENYDEVIEIPLTYQERESTEKDSKPNFTNIVSRLIDQFPLLQQLLKL